MKSKVDPVEQAHFRIDEHERKLREVEKIGAGIPDMVNGGVAALHAGMKAEVAQILANQAKDIQTDTAVVERLDRLCECIERQCEKLDALIAVLGAPCTRESTINLPSGPVHMTVRERKN
jgi:hypothetical protein